MENFLKFRKKIAIQLIVDKVIDDSDYDECIKQTKKNLKKNTEFIDGCNRFIDRLDKSLRES